MCYTVLFKLSFFFNYLFFYNVLKYMGQLRWLSGLAPPSAWGLILESLHRVPRRAPCMESASPSACVSASLSHCVPNTNKKIKLKLKIFFKINKNRNNLLRALGWLQSIGQTTVDFGSGLISGL